MEFTDPKQEALCNWLLVPSPLRDPKTLAEFARSIGAGESTLSKWKKAQYFQNEYNRRWRELASGADKVKEVIDSLQTAAANGNVNAAKLYLEWAKEYEPTSTVKVKGADELRNLSDAEFAKRFGDLHAV